MCVFYKQDNKMICITLFIVLLSQDVMTASVAKIDSDCAVPSEDDLVRIFAESGEFFAYIINDEDDDQTPEETKTNTTSLDDENTATMTNLHCPVGEIIDKSAPIRLRSVCPWELIDDYDSNRYPKTIQKAVCRCNHCIDPSSNKLNEDLSCVPVYYPMPVLRRTGCKNGVATFEPRYEQVPVACDCKTQAKHRNIQNGVPAMKM
ncbi:uncharacterized protein [Amphiura filiformis]|uniref:uncharacterized protein n=1 Tax=Amphiura filiformis TaxID=82378 RepID=UPI003B20EABB